MRTPAPKPPAKRFVLASGRRGLHRLYHEQLTLNKTTVAMEHTIGWVESTGGCEESIRMLRQAMSEVKSWAQQLRYERHVDDYYVTPHWLINEFLDEFARRSMRFWSTWTYSTQVQAGEKYPMSYPTVLNNRGFNVESWDLREDSRAERKGIDFLQQNSGLELNQYDMIITNPPFKVSQEFVYQALKMVRSGGLVIML